jgi:hypothetical protein
MIATSARPFVAVAVLAAAQAGCHISVDYSDTMYRCPDGRCPTGFTSGLLRRSTENFVCH